MLRGAEIFLQCLRAEDVDLVFGYPGRRDHAAV